MWGGANDTTTTVIGKKGPRTGTTLKSAQDIAAAQRKGLAVETEKKCKIF
jgi:hypothetical protein